MVVVEKLQIPVLDFLLIINILLLAYSGLLLLLLRKMLKIKHEQSLELKELRLMLNTFASHSVVFWILDQLEMGVSESEIRRKLTVQGYSQEQQELLLNKAKALKNLKQ